VLIVDYKTTEGAVDAHACERRIADMGLQIQAAAYIDAVETLSPELQGRVRFIFQWQEQKPPYALSSPIEMSEAASKFRQPVFRQNEGALLCRRKVRQSNDRDLFESNKTGSIEPRVACKNPVAVINQDRDREPECPDAVGKLADLVTRMRSRFPAECLQFTERYPAQAHIVCEHGIGVCRGVCTGFRGHGGGSFDT
jgi:hypothetical protein